MAADNALVPAVLIRELNVRVIDVSAGGILVEADRRMAVHTLGRLKLRSGYEEHVEDVDVVRCQAIKGTGLYHIGMRFMFTTVRHPRSIRRWLAHVVADLPAGHRKTSWLM